ncbi:MULTISPECIES: response regulator transcription factor [unclassified Corynebacterium]|uniref:response regulator transcription factor n=1 Tax=unclassified Corynebacterium TaxID=2624378 RepID=UPI0030A97933
MTTESVPDSATIRVAIADDEELIVSSLATLLGLERDIDVVATCGSGEELVAECQRQLVAGDGIDVCVVDLQMDGIDGIDTAVELGKLARLRVDARTPKVLIVTSFGRPRDLKRALTTGVQGFMPKTASAVQFADAIRTVQRGKRYVDPELAALAISESESPLTERERQVLELTGTGMSMEEIAATIHLAPGTTRNYVSAAISKVGARNRFEAFAKAQESGWL